MNAIKSNYEFMARMKNTLAGLGHDKRTIDKALVNIKRETRRMNRPIRNSGSVKTIKDKDDPMSWYNVWKLPFQMTFEEQCDYEDEFATRINSPYDCTGKPFTRWMHFANVSDGTTIVIEAMSIDC